LGKTVISAIIAANILYNYKNFKILVMAPTRPLVMQHRNSFMRLLKLRDKDTALLTGKTSPDYRRLIWEGESRIIFQDPYESLNPRRSVANTILQPINIHGLARDESEKEALIRKMLEEVELVPPDEFIDRYPHICLVVAKGKGSRLQGYWCFSRSSLLQMNLFQC